MSNHQKIYIARQVLLSGQHEIRIDEESVFDKFEKAKKFLDSLWEEDDDPNSKYSMSFRNIIIELPLNIEDSWEHTREWIYSLDGKLLKQHPCEDDSKTSFELHSYEELFSVGEIVEIKPTLDNEAYVHPDFPDGEEFGVIGETPVNKNEWKASGKPLSDWDPAYIVYFIDIAGGLEHIHLEEERLIKLSRTLPGELGFLKLFSEHLKKPGETPRSVEIEKALKENWFLRFKKCFPK